MSVARRATSTLQRAVKALWRALTAPGGRRARSAPPAGGDRVRILLLHANGMGGTIRAVFHLAGYLARTRDVEIVSVIRESAEPFFPVPPGVRIRYLDDRLGGRNGLLSRLPSALVPKDEAAYHRFTLRTDLALARYVRSVRDGILIGTRPGLNLIMARFARPEVVTVAQEHANLASHRPSVRRQIGLWYGRHDAVVALTAADLGTYTRGFERSGRPRPRVLTRIPNAATPLDGGPSPLTEKTVITIGRLAHAKGHDMLIKAWAHVAARHPDWTLRIVGDGPRRKPLQESIAAMGLTGRVVLAGRIRDVAAELEKASIFVLSSRREGMPLVILEAMGKGVPVVSFDCPTGPAELITHGHDGLLVEMGDVRGLADAICTLIEDEELRRRMGARAVRTAAGYDLGSIGRQWDRLLTGLAAARRPGTAPRAADARGAPFRPGAG